jgi:hypothetical protein
MGFVAGVKSILDAMAFRRNVGKDPWLRQVTDYTGELLHRKERRPDHPFVELLQTADDRARDVIVEHLATELNTIAASSDRLLACRDWIHRAATVHGNLRILFIGPIETSKEAAGDMYHPGVTGLNEYIDRIIELRYQDEYRRAGSLEELKRLMALENVRESFYLHVGNYARVALGDVPREGRRDWVRPYVNAISFFSEHHYRGKLGLPQFCDSLAMLREFKGIENNVLRGYNDPLEGVTFATLT